MQRNLATAGEASAAASRESRAATASLTAAAAPATAIPRGVWLSGLAVLVLVAIAVVVATSLPGRTTSFKNSSGAPQPPPALTQAGDEPPARRGRSAIDEQIAEVPDAYAEYARILLTSDDPRARARAGEAIAFAPEEDKPAIPEYLRNLAWFEEVRDCEDKRPILDKIRDSGDVRALPGLERIAATPESSCGSGFMRFECIECLRDELARVIARFSERR